MSSTHDVEGPPPPIFTLSDDIVSEVFLIGKAQAEHQKSLSAESPKTTADQIFLLNITHVCQLWRQIALDTLELWSTISLDHHHLLWTAELAKRSKGAPLRLHVGGDFESLNPTYLSLASQLLSEHARLLRVSIQSFGLTATPLSLLELESGFKCAPLLQHLLIYLIGEELPPNLLWDSMPSLRTLRLFIEHCPELPTLPGLTGLYLGLPVFPCNIQISKLLQVFQGSPRLEVVSVAFSSSLGDESPQKDLCIPLSQLKAISFDFTSELQFSVLRHLDFPASAIFKASYPSSSQLSNETLSLLQEIVIRSSDHLHRSAVGSISLQYNEDHDWGKFDFTIKVSLPPGIDGDTVDALSLCLPMPRESREDLYSGIFQGLPWSDASSLRISNYSCPEMFSLASGIRFLELNAFNIEMYRSDGTQALTPLRWNDNLDLPCPRLETITIRHSKAYRNRHDDAQDMFSVLIDIITERQDISPIRLVQLSYCWVRRYTLERLEQITTVECDEHTRNSGERYYRFE